MRRNKAWDCAVRAPASAQHHLNSLTLMDELPAEFPAATGPGQLRRHECVLLREASFSRAAFEAPSCDFATAQFTLFGEPRGQLFISLLSERSTGFCESKVVEKMVFFPSLMHATHSAIEERFAP